jgi:hypothetical protein
VLTCVCRDGWDVKKLATVVLDTRKHDESKLVRFLVNEVEDVLRGHEVPIIWLDKTHRLLRIQAMPLNLRLNGIPITRERPPLAHDLVLLFCWLVESGHHEVQVDGQCVHGNDL